MSPTDPAQRPDPIAVRVASGCLLMRTRRLSRILTRIYVEHMRAVDMSVSQYTLLAAIGANPGARASDLSAALDIEKSTLSRELVSITRNGWVRVVATEGRAQALALTDDGASRLSAAMTAWEAAQGAAVIELGPLAAQLIGHFADP
jgi:DNA-binding MarR family transcriptional regulator